MAFISTTLPSLPEQAERLVEVGVPAQFGLSNNSALEAASLSRNVSGALLVPTSTPESYSELTRLIRHGDQPGFVVEDFTDIRDFTVFEGADQTPVETPSGSWYLLLDPARGDEFGNASPAEALQQISEDGRVAVSMVEGIMLALQAPEVLERNFCYMTIGSRKRKSNGGFDSRTPALWISNGTGRDGKSRRNAPKLGWCWWNNRHTWLGMAHAARRLGTKTV